MLIYVGTPYTVIGAMPEAEEKALLRFRYDAACQFTAFLSETEEEHTFFSPIAHGHTIEQWMRSRKSGSWWMNHCREMLKHCGRMYVLMLDGWYESTGLTEERLICTRDNIVLSYHDYAPELWGNWRYNKMVG